MKNICTLITILWTITSSAITMSNEDRFWKWFVKNEQIYHQDLLDLEKKYELEKKILKKLQQIHPKIYFEHRFNDQKNSREVVFTSYGEKEAFPFIKNLVQKAPALDRWKFIAFKQRVYNNPKAFEFKVSSLGKPFHFDLENIYFEYNEGEQLALAVYIPAHNMYCHEKKRYLHKILEKLLGEYDLATEINKHKIYLKAIDKEVSTKYHPIILLRKVIDKRKRERNKATRSHYSKKN